MYVKTPSKVSYGSETLWQFDVPKEKSRYWSIMLSYLMQDTEAILENLKRMCNDDVVASEKIISCIKSYNPFLNRHACFYNDDLVKLLKQLEMKIQQNMKDRCNEKLTVEMSPKLSYLLRVACEILECKFCVYTIDKENVIGQPLRVSNGQDEVPEIKLFHKGSKKICNWHIITFTLPNTVALNLQKTAASRLFANIGIKDTQVLDAIFPIASNHNLLGALVTQEEHRGKCLMTVRKLLENSFYVLNKFSDAGFQTDPLCNASAEDGISDSVFYKFMQVGNIDLLHLLYNYAIHASLWFDHSIRNPDAGIVDRLLQLVPVLNQAKTAYKKNDCPKEQDVVQIETLVRFHDFQKNICQKMLKVRERINFNDGTSDRIFSACKKKDIILSIIEEFKFHYHMELDVGESDESEKSLMLYENYCKYHTFYSCLDLQVALLFYDNSFSLKKSMNINYSWYDVFETSLAKFLFVTKYYMISLNDVPFQQGHTKKTLTRCRSQSSSSNRKMDLLLTYLIHTERLELWKEIDNFQISLQDVEFDYKNEESEAMKNHLKGVYSMEHEPIIKDQLLAYRLNNYFNQALEVDLYAKPNAGVFAILRCIQAIGESITLGLGEKPTALKSILVHALLDVSECGLNNSDFRKLRDSLSHHDKRRTSFISRMELEEDLIFFKEVQREISTVKEKISYIFKLQELRMSKYAIQRAIHQVKEWKKQLSSEHKTALDMNMFAGQDDGGEEKTNGNNTPQGEKKKTGYKSIKNNLHNIFQKLTPIAKNISKQLRELLISNLEKFENNSKNHLSDIKNKYEEIKTSDQKSMKDSEAGKVNKTGTKKKKSKEEIRKEKVQRLKDNFSTAKCLLNFITLEAGYEVKDKKKLMETVKALKEDMEINEVESQIEEYYSARDMIFSALKNSRKIAPVRFKISNPHGESSDHVRKLLQVFEGNYFISNETKERIISEISPKYVIHHEAMRKLIISLQTENHLSTRDLEKECDKLTTNSKQVAKVKALYEARDLPGLESCIDWVQTLKSSWDKNEIKGHDFKTVCNSFNFSNDIKTTLGKIVMGRPKISEKKELEFLYDRLKKLFNLLIDPYPHINRLWKKGIAEKTKEFTRHEIVRVFVKDPVLQVAVEQLLFDCMVILKENKTREYLEHIWIKANNLFSGINMRNVFAHGHPLMECVTPFLDSCDLPREIVSKVLMLLTDLDAIAAMVEWREQEDIKFDKLVKEVKNDEVSEKEELKVRIRSSTKWEDYANLIPRDENEAFPSKEWGTDDYGEGYSKAD